MRSSKSIITGLLVGPAVTLALLAGTPQGAQATTAATSASSMSQSVTAAQLDPCRWGKCHDYRRYDKYHKYHRRYDKYRRYDRRYDKYDRHDRYDKYDHRW